MTRRRYGTTRAQPQRAIDKTQIPFSAALAGSSITSGQVLPQYLGTGVRDGTKFLRDDGTWQPVSGGGGLGARGDVVKTTASLGDGIEEQGTMALGKSFVPFRITVDRACRVRFYQTAAARTADAGRSPGVDPVGEHGLLLDIRLNGSTGLTWDITDPPTCMNMESTVVADISYIIKNESGATSTVQVTITRVLLET